MISLAFPYALLALPLPYLLWRFAPPYRSRTPALRLPFFRQLTAAAGVEAGPGATELRRTRLQGIAAIAIWLCLVTAMARPEQLGEPIQIESAGRDLILAIDISGSMDTVDMATESGPPEQRLAVVQRVVRQFVAEREGDRVALIAFGSNAYLQAPPTEDLETVTTLLDQTQVGMAGPHTALGDAIGLAIRTFETSEVDDRLLVLLTDGNDTASAMSPVSAAAIAADRGVQIITVAVGDPDATGEDRVDLATLRSIASSTGGASYYATDSDALADIYAQIDALAPRDVQVISQRPRSPLAHWLLAAALLIGLGTILALRLGAVRRDMA
jgi:Ca-activated chloride channel family protein